MNYKQLFHIDLWKSLGAVFWADEWQMTGKAGVETEIHIYYENSMGTWHMTEEDLTTLLWSNGSLYVYKHRVL